MPTVGRVNSFLSIALFSSALKTTISVLFFSACRGGHRGHGVHPGGGRQRRQHQRRGGGRPLQPPEQLQRHQLHSHTFPQTTAAPLLGTAWSSVPQPASSHVFSSPRSTCFDCHQCRPLPSSAQFRTAVHSELAAPFPAPAPPVAHWAEMPLKPALSFLDHWPYLTLLHHAWTRPSWHTPPSHCPHNPYLVLPQAQREQRRFCGFCGVAHSFDLLIRISECVCLCECVGV